MNFAPALFLKGQAHIAGVQLFNHLELKVNPGLWTCILGASGVGKSSVLKLFAGQSEHISFEGVCEASPPAVLGQCCTLMAQDDLLLPWLSVLENAQLGARLRGEEPDQTQALRILEYVGLSDMSRRKPHELSGGQRQRTALARTLMEDRPVVLLDEPFSALDALTRSNMQELAAQLLQDKTVLLITHDPNEAARLAHHCFIMTPTGLTPCDLPKGQTPRPFDDLDVLATQGRLLSQLRGSS